jgi:hypothetical protein
MYHWPRNATRVVGVRSGLTGLTTVGTPLYRELATLATERRVQTGWFACLTLSSNCPSLLSFSVLYDFLSLSHVLPTRFCALCSF